MSYSTVKFVLDKLFGTIINHPLISLVVIVLIISFLMIYFKNLGDKGESKYQHWVLWGGVGLVVVVVTFVFLKMISIGKFLV